MSKKLIPCCLISLMCTSCTYSITMVHTTGTATDIVDTDQGASAKIDPNINIPISPIP